MHGLGRFAALVMALVPTVYCDSPSADELPFWPMSVLWNPKRPVATCSPIDSALPHGPATWEAPFKACVNTLAYFDTCADDACVDAFDAASAKALNCSYDGKIGTAREVETNRLERCVAARKVENERYIPEQSSSAPQCTPAQLATWDATYKNSTDYNSCLKAVTTTRGTRTCLDYCRRVFHDAVSDAGECLFSAQVGSVTHHEWLKYLLVWCIEARGETLRADPLLYVKGTVSPAPTPAKPTKTPSPSPTTPPTMPSLDSSSSDDIKTPKPTKKPTPKTTSPPSEASSASQETDDDISAGSGAPIDSASSQEEATQVPVVSPPTPVRPSYGGGTSSAADSLGTHGKAVILAVSIALVQLV